MIRNKEDAKAAADAWLIRNGGEFRYEHLSVSREPTEWTVMLAVFTKEGHGIDGPIVLQVDAESGIVSTIVSP